jgi:hypothetical protein
MLRTARRMLATSVVIATMVASCGGGTGKSNGAAAQSGSRTTEAFQPPTPLQAVQNAVVATHDAASARYTGSFFFDAGPLLGTNDPGSGVIALQNGDANYTVDMHFATTGVVPPGTPPAQAQLHVLDLGNKLYLNFPAAFSYATGVGNNWVPINQYSAPAGEQNPVGFQGVNSRVFLAARLLRPASCLEIVQGATAARVVGPEDVKGKPTTRYSIQWAPRTWVENSGLFYFFGKDRSPARLAAIDRVLSTATTADVWVDELGRIRKVVASADLSVIKHIFDASVSNGPWRSLRTECDFFDYGTPSGAITAPTNVFAPATSG